MTDPQYTPPPATRPRLSSPPAGSAPGEDIAPPTSVERLLAVSIKATDDGGALITIYTRAADGYIYVGDLTAERYVADMLRNEVAAAIPNRPPIPVDVWELQRRLTRIADPRI